MLLDAALPDGDGLSLARRIAADATLAGCATILLSPLDRLTSEQTLGEAGVRACVAKPVKESRLFDAIATTLAGGDQAADSLARSYRRLPAAALQLHADAAPRQTLRILLAEDNAVNQLVGLDQLGSLGFQADVVPDGAAAVEALRERAYDVVLMDCMMPRLDGLEATRRIRELERRRAPGFDRPTPLRIIAMTANAQPGDRETCLAAGMDGYISKPVRTQDLRSALEHYEAAARRAAGTDRNGRVPAAHVEPAARPVFREDKPAPETAPGSTGPIDKERLEQVLAIGHERARGLVRSYIEGAEAMKEALAAALVRHAPGEVRTLAHRWAGSSSTCGLNALAAALHELENLARGGSLAGADKRYANIIACYEEARPVLEHRVATPRAHPPPPIHPADIPPPSRIPHPAPSKSDPIPVSLS